MHGRSCRQVVQLVLGCPEQEALACTAGLHLQAAQLVAHAGIALLARAHSIKSLNCDSAKSRLQGRLQLGNRLSQGTQGQKTPFLTLTGSMSMAHLVCSTSSRSHRAPPNWKPQPSAYMDRAEGGDHPPPSCLATTRPLPKAALHPRPTYSALHIILSAGFSRQVQLLRAVATSTMVI